MSGTITFDGIDEHEHEAIYHARIRATSALPNELDQDPYDNPNTMYKDIRLLVGDFDELIDNMFTVDLEDFIYMMEILDEWDEREEGIYHETTDDGFGIVEEFIMPPIPYYLLIKYKVGDIDECGVLRIPPGLPPNDLGWPMMVFCHWGRFVSEDGALPLGGFEYYTDYKNKFVELIPRYRGNALCWFDEEYDPDPPLNEEVNSPADYDVDDVLAFLNVVRNNEDLIENCVNYQGDELTLLDQGKVGIMGGSRGGSPAYLAKIRDNYYGKNQIDRALITIGSVSNFFLEDIAESCRKYIEYDGYVPEPESLYPPEDGFTHHYYNTDYNVFARVLEPYLHGDMTYPEAYKRLLRSSPWVWAGLLDNVQVHHGVDDKLGRVAQTWALWDLLGQDPGNTELRIYPTANHLIEGTDSDMYYNETYDYATAIWLDAIIDGD